MCFFFVFFYVELMDNTTICLIIVRSKWCNEHPLTSEWNCQVRSLPMVVPTKGPHQQAENLLECLDAKDSFLKNCPDLRDDGTELTDLCNHIKTNNGGCHLGSFQCTTQNLMNQVSTVIHKYHS